MAWQVAILLDRETHAGSYLGLMPTWARSTPDRQLAAAELGSQWDSCWAPEPALTLFVTQSSDQIGELENLIPTIQEHHPRLTCIRLFGIVQSTRLTETMTALSYHPIAETSYEGLAYARRLDELPNIPDVIVDLKGLKDGASEWQVMNYFYDEFFRAVGAPAWHGRNDDALIDSIEGGAINQIEVPYRIVIRNIPRENNAVERLLDNFSDLVRGMQSNGCPVVISIENKPITPS